MQPGKIVFKGKTRKGRDVFLRYMQSADVVELCGFINTLSEEQTFIMYQGKQLTLEEEQKWVDTQIKKIAVNKTIHLIALCDGSIVGSSGLDMKQDAEKHIGSFGITIAKGYRGDGVGSLLMEHVLREAVENFSELQIITLGVFGDNEVAKCMYKKFGFQEYGRLPGGVLHAEVAVDHIYMYKIVEPRL